MDLGCAVLHGFLHIQDEGIFLILYLDRADGLGCGYLVFCHYGGDVIPVKPHLIR